MAPLRDRLPWPTYVADLYYDLVRDNGVCIQLLELCVHEGIRRDNAGVVNNLLPKILRRVQEMQSTARQIRAMVPARRRGREPKWATLTLDILANLVTISEQIEIAIDEQSAHHNKVVDYLVRKALEGSQHIFDLLGLLPVETIPEAFREAFLNDNV